MLKLCGLARSTFYYHLNQCDKNKYEVEEKEIQNIFKNNKGIYGYRRITEMLHKQGYYN